MGTRTGPRQKKPQHAACIPCRRTIDSKKISRLEQCRALSIQRTTSKMRLQMLRVIRRKEFIYFTECTKPILPSVKWNLRDPFLIILRTTFGVPKRILKPRQAFQGSSSIHRLKHSSSIVILFSQRLVEVVLSSKAVFCKTSCRCVCTGASPRHSMRPIFTYE